MLPTRKKVASMILGVALSAPLTSTGSATEIPRARTGVTLLVGDSMMRIGVGPVLKKTLPKSLPTRVEMHAKSATGLARPDFYDWPKALRAMIKDTKYDRAVVMMGANDCQNIQHDGSALDFGSTAWQEVYGKRVSEFLAILCENVDRVIWLGLPPMRNGKFDGRVRQLNGFIEAQVKSSSCGRYLPVTSVLAEADGKFMTHRKVGKRRLRIREEDGVHVTQNGGQLVSDDLLKYLLDPAHW